MIQARTPKILGILLTYPTEDMMKALPEIKNVLADESWLSSDYLQELNVLFEHFEKTDLLDLQEQYVELFDRTPSLALHLFEHIHGDSRERGQALVDLDSLYREVELHNDSEHTPDYLPLFLEYLSVLPPQKAREDLGGAINVIAALGERLKNRDSEYAVLFAALQNISDRQPNEDQIKKALEADSGRPMTNEEMDAAWEEQFAFANQDQQGSGGCPKAEEMLRRMETHS